jgi:hypothetical protein
MNVTDAGPIPLDITNATGIVFTFDAWGAAWISVYHEENGFVYYEGSVKLNDTHEKTRQDGGDMR